MKTKVCTLILTLILGAFMNSCKKDELDNGPVGPIDSDHEWVDATVQLPSGSGYQLVGHELNAMGETVEIGANGATKVPKMENAVAIYIITNAQDKPVLMGYSTPGRTEISAESTAKVTLFTLYRIATLPVEEQVAFLEGFEEDSAADPYIEGFVEHWASNPNTLMDRGYLPLLKEYHAGYHAEGVEVPLVSKDAKTKDGRYYYAEADTVTVTNGFALRLKPPNKFHVRNEGPGSGTAFIYKTKIKKNNSLNHQTLITAFESGTKSDKAWFVENGTYISQGLPFIGKVDYRNFWHGKPLFKEIVSGPHELPLADDEEEAEYAIRIVNAGVGASRDKLTADEYAAYVKHVHAALIMDYYLPFVGTYMDLDIQDFYAMDAEDRVNKLDAAVRESGLHTEIEPYLAQGKLPVVLEMLEAYFQSEAMEYGLKLHQAVSKAVGKSGSASMISAAKRAGHLSYYFDGGLFWAAEQEKRLFRDFYWETSGLATLVATAKAGVVRVSPRKANITASAPGNEVELTATIESEDFKDLEVTYKWEIVDGHGNFVVGPNQGATMLETDDNKVTYKAFANPTLTGTLIDKVIVSVLKDGELVGKDSSSIHIAPSRYKLTPAGLTLTGDSDRGPNIANLKIVPAVTGTPEIGSDPDVDVMVQWKTAGKHGGLRWQGDYATYWTTETESYNSATVQYRCDDDQTKNGEEIVEALIFQKPKGAPESEYLLQGIVSTNIKILNDEKKIIRYYPLVPAFLQGVNYGIPGGSDSLCGDNWGTFVDVEPNAVSYQWHLIEVERVIIGATRHYSWNEGGGRTEHPYYPGVPLHLEGVNNLGGQYFIGYAGRNYVCGNPNIGPFPSNAGMAQVIITVK